MKETRFMYKGAEVVVQDNQPEGTVTVDKRKFKVSHHHEGGLAMWMCDEAYFASPDLMELARHFVDYGYMFDAPGRHVVRNEHGKSGQDNTTNAPAQKSKAHKPTHGG